jgi:AcrR family transcriptional regulator
VSAAESSSRTYRSELRQRQAAETRTRIVEAAVEVLGENGYQAATFAQIAKRAGVSVETVQKHGPKTALMWAAVESASFGSEGRDRDIFATDYGKALLDVGDPDEFAARLGETMLAINEPAAGVWAAVTAAALGDPEVRTQMADRLAEIRKQTGKALRIAAARGWVRTDVPFDDLLEAVCVVVSVESYVRFVHWDGKSRKKYKTFIARTIRDTILVP